MEPSTERSLAERASQQLGLITRTQLRQLGATRWDVEHRIRRGLLDPVGRQTFRRGGVPPSSEGQVLALCLDTGGVASHRTAAALHGLAGFRLAALDTFEVSIPDGRRNPVSPLGIVHRTTNLGRDDLQPVGPIPCTSVARTMLGLAALVPVVTAEDLRDAIDVAVRDGVASDRWLWWRLERLRCRGRDGVSVLEAALTDRVENGATESWLEREFLGLMADAGLRAPVVQRRVRAAGAFVARVDFAYEPERIIMEVKGHRGHSTRRQRAADDARANRLQLLGFQVLQFTYDHVVATPYVDVVPVVRAALELCAAHAR